MVELGLPAIVNELNKVIDSLMKRLLEKMAFQQKSSRHSSSTYTSSFASAGKKALNHKICGMQTLSFCSRTRGTAVPVTIT